MALHHPNQVRAGRGLKPVFGNFLDAADEAPTIGAIEEGLDISRTELQVGDDVGLTDPDGESLKASRNEWIGDDGKQGKDVSSQRHLTKIKPRADLII